MKKISVIIPVYNGEKYVEKCLDSLLIQEDYIFEIIVINDGSTDNTRKMLSSYEKKNNRVRVYNQENAGVSAARNKGIDYATGDWIVFCDVDDNITDGYFKDIDTQISSHEDYDLLCYARIHVGRDDWSSDRWDIKRKEMLMKTLGGDSSYCNEDYVITTVWGKAFKKDIFDRGHVRFNTKIDFGEDTLFMIEYILNSEHFGLLHRGYYEYYVNPQGACQKGGSIRDYYGFSEFDCVIQELKRNNTLLDDYEIDKSLARYMIKLSTMMRGRIVRSTKSLSISQRVELIHGMYKKTRKYMKLCETESVKYVLINMFAREYILLNDRKG